MLFSILQWARQLPKPKIYLAPNLTRAVVEKHCSKFSHSSVDKESACNAGDPDSIPGLGRSPGERNSYPLQYSGLENSMVCVVRGVAKSRTRLSNFHFTLVAQLVKNLPAMWETWVHSWVGKIPWRKEQLPTPVFWPGEFQGLTAMG